MNLDKLKTHIHEHRDVYIGVGIGLTIAGITWTIVRGKSTDLVAGSVPDLVAGTGDSARSVVDNTTRSFSFGFNNHTTSINNAVTTIHTGTRGNPGFVTRCIETGELFETQDAAARAFGIPAEFLSKHLNYGRPLKEGLHFERLGVFQ